MSEDTTEIKAPEEWKLDEAYYHAQLMAPFHPFDIEWRIAQAGMGDNGVWAKAFAYIDSRAIMDRLDSLFGPFGWQTSVRQLNPMTYYEKDWDTKKDVAKVYEGFVTSIGVRDPFTGEWIWKEDGANNTDFEAVKGGISGALKRGAVSLGIGRYLYDLPETYVIIHEGGVFNSQVNVKEDGGRVKKWINWSPTGLPENALPSPDLTLESMSTFIKDNYKPELGDNWITVGTKNRKLQEAGKMLQAVKGKDYYLTLYIYTGLKEILESE